MCTMTDPKPDDTDQFMSESTAARVRVFATLTTHMAEMAKSKPEDANAGRTLLAVIAGTIHAAGAMAGMFSDNIDVPDLATVVQAEFEAGVEFGRLANNLKEN
jgi:hypothetical protein